MLGMDAMTELFLIKRWPAVAACFVFCILWSGPQRILVVQ